MNDCCCSIVVTVDGKQLVTLRAEPLLFLFALILITLGTKHMYRKKRFCLQGGSWCVISVKPPFSNFSGIV